MLCIYTYIHIQWAKEKVDSKTLKSKSVKSVQKSGIVLYKEIKTSLVSKEDHFD